MRIFNLPILLLLMLTPACAAKGETNWGVIEAATSDEAAERKIIFDQVQNAVSARNFTVLNTLENEYRTRRSRTPSGIWKLAAYHGAVRFYVQQEKHSTQCDDSSDSFVKAWANADPAQPGAYITEASLLLDRAWCFRGSGLASAVPTDAWAPFHANVDAAYRTLATHEKIAAKDPEFYAVMETIYIAQGRDKAEFRKLLVEATDREPYYYSLYFNAFRYYQPQWFGSPAEVDELARFAAARTKNLDGMGAYARFYWFTTDCRCRISRASIDWPTMKAAMQDVVRRYPGDWNASHFAKLSCQMGDAAEAARYLAMLTVDDGSAWEDKDEWHACQRIAKDYQAAAGR